MGMLAGLAALGAMAPPADVPRYRPRTYNPPRRPKSRHRAADRSKKQYLLKGVRP
jgi:hypothetical protein